MQAHTPHLDALVNNTVSHGEVKVDQCGGCRTETVCEIAGEEGCYRLGEMAGSCSLLYGQARQDTSPLIASVRLRSR